MIDLDCSTVCANVHPCGPAGIKNNQRILDMSSSVVSRILYFHSSCKTFSLENVRPQIYLQGKKEATHQQLNGSLINQTLTDCISICGFFDFGDNIALRR